MALNLSSWFGIGSALAPTPTATEAARAALAWRRILDKPSSVAFKNTAGTVLAAQTVRIESDSVARPATSEAGMTATRRIVVFGIKGHATLAATIMEEGYRFVLSNDEYRIVEVIETIGERQGLAEAVG